VTGILEGGRGIAAIIVVANHSCSPSQSNLINENLVVFVISTTANGDFPTSSLSFWKFLLRSNLPKDILSDLSFTTFGLGDSSYSRFCWPSRKLNKRLKGLGAEELIESGEGDDQHYLGIEGSLRPWMDKLWETLDQVLPPKHEGEEILGDNEALPPRIRVTLRESQALTGNTASSSKGLSTGWRWAKLTKMQRITSKNHWQDVRLVEVQDEQGQAIE
jgi:sulfite reductase alpha subunit-like flavoprotein